MADILSAKLLAWPHLRLVVGKQNKPPLISSVPLPAPCSRWPPTTPSIVPLAGTSCRWLLSSAPLLPSAVQDNLACPTTLLRYHHRRFLTLPIDSQAATRKHPVYQLPHSCSAANLWLPTPLLPLRPCHSSTNTNHSPASSLKLRTKVRVAWETQKS